MYLIVFEVADVDIGPLVENQNLIPGELKAIYRKPTMFCEGLHPTGKTGQAFTKGKKWGWWVCSYCKKPKQLYWRNVFGDNQFGYNVMNLFKKDHVDEV